MKYTLLTDGSKPIPCKDHSEQDVFYTARTMSKYGQSKVDVYRSEIFIAAFVNGKRVKNQKSA